MSTLSARRTTVVCLALVLNLTIPTVAFAGDQTAAPAEPQSVLAMASATAAAADVAVARAESSVGPTPQSLDDGSQPGSPVIAIPTTLNAVPAVSTPMKSRPAALVPLYVSLASLQVLDVTSTLKALGSGAGVEANPVMRTVVGSPAAMIALKTGFAGLSIYSSEKLWKRNRAAAILMMVGLNGAYAAVVAHNFSVQ